MEAQDNPYTYITLVETADPTTPAAGTKRLWVDTDDGLKIIDEADVVTVIGGAVAADDVTFTPAAGIAATDVQAAIVEDAGDLAAHIADAAAAHAASAIAFTPHGSIAATDVQAAIQEVRDEAGGAGLTDHTHAVTGSGATGGGDTLNPVTMKLPAAMGTTAGQVEYDTATYRVNVYDSQRERTVSAVGWMPHVLPFAYDPGVAFSTAVALAANGGSMLIPMVVPANMLFQDVSVRNTDSASARTWMWDLYVNDLNNGNGGENTARRVATGSAAESFTASAASNRFIACSGAPVYLAPGVYFLVIQNQHATNTFGIGTTAQNAASVALTTATGKTKTTTNPNGATLDLVAATWTTINPSIGVIMRGRVLGQTAAWS